MILPSLSLQVAISTLGTVLPFTTTDSRIVSVVAIPSPHVNVAVNAFWNDEAQVGSSGMIPNNGLPEAGKSIVTCRSYTFAVTLLQHLNVKVAAGSVIESAWASGADATPMTANSIAMIQRDF
ncbi:hypothetical protein [Tunturiibacter gelidoferens]|uniref:Uncharacterized protein n=1 Tax=Tunturiibacter gelidiferens TaxID=3069689 RepID=A0ACC5NT43_9BACT|nr:hypothetical protein [Edaphobacter lichenicola]MBB5337732.1 hypothetical protein [Edaphobacter lichenicola]